MVFKTKVKVLKVKIASLKHHIVKACNNKLSKNFSQCGFYLISPKNGSNTRITFNSHIVGEVSDGKMKVFKFDPKHWRQEVYKYDILCEIQHQIHPEETNKEKTNGEEEDKLEG